MPVEEIDVKGPPSTSGWSPVSVDLTAYAGQLVKLAFFHEEYDNTAWGGDEQAPGWYIDDVQIWQGVPTMRPLEDFEVGWGDWSTDHGVWQVGEPTSGPAAAHSGTAVAATILNGNYPAQTDSRLISPAFEVPIVAGNEQILIRYWQWFQYADYSGELQVSYKYGNADAWSSWEPLPLTVADGNSAGWQPANANLTDYMGMTIRLGFYHQSGSTTKSGWYIDDMSLNHFTPPSIKLGALTPGFLASVAERDYWVLLVPAGGHLTLTLNDLDDIGANEIYLKHGSLPTAGDFDYRFSKFGSADQQIYVPDAKPGYWFVMVAGSDVPEGGSDYTVLAEHASGVIVDKVTPDHYGAANGARLTIEGAGFTPGIQVELLSNESMVTTATTMDYYSGRKIGVDFDLTGLAPGEDYLLRIRVDDSTAELPFSVTDPIPAELRTHMVLPRNVGYHRPATIWVEYENVGQVAMEAPLLVVSARQRQRTAAILHTGGGVHVDSGAEVRVIPLTGAMEVPTPRGFWTSAMPDGYANTVQFLASGSVSGLIQPGEKGRFPIYWAGWQQPWDFSYPDIIFTLGVVKDSNAEPIDWSGIKDNMRPDTLDPDTWEALWSAFTAEAGNTWGAYVDMLQANAIYLGRLGIYVNDVSDLLAFEFAQADGLNVVRTLASSTDAHVAAPGLDITFRRTYGQSISSRYTLGDFGRGWSHNWAYHLAFESDGTIRLMNPGGGRRTYQPDSRPNRPYFSMEGDHAIFESVAGGYRHQEANGFVRFFDAMGRLSYVEDASGSRITCIYSGNQLTRLEHSAGQFIDIGWSGDRITSVTDPAGRVNHYTYNGGGGYLDRVVSYDQSSVAYTYETAGAPAQRHAITSITFPGNTHQYFTWDARGRLSGISRDGGAEPIALTYGQAGEVFVTDAFANTSSYYLDHRGILVRATDPQGDAIALDYDNDYNLTTVIDPAGRSYNYAYNTEGDMIRMTDPLGFVTRLSYTGPFNRLTGLVDAKGNVTRYAYSDSGNLSSISYDDGSVESWNYTGSGSPSTWINRRGTPIGYEYNTDGRLTAKVFTNNVRMEYHWDLRGNLDYTVDPNGTTDFTYDTNAFLVRIDYPGNHWLGYSWNEAGQRTALTNELGDVQHYHYDAVGRLESMTDDEGGLIVRYEYDAAGRLVKKTLGNGVYTTYDYNESWELISLANMMPDDTILSRFDYEYDSRGRRIAMTSTYGQADDPRTNYIGRWTYDYDDLGQLVAWEDPSGHRVEYEYDALGNRITVTEDGVVTEYTANNMNQYTQVGDTTYTFDLDGNLVHEDRVDGSWTAYTYNDENRLASIETSDGQSWEYGYNALGYRNRVTDKGVSEADVIDTFGLGNLVGVYPASSDPTMYIHGFGLVNQQVGMNQSEWFTFDAIGSVQEIALSDGYIAENNVYEPFGDKSLKDGSITSRFMAYGLWGIERDAGNTLFMRARNYDLKAGRFMSHDPIGIRGNDMNLYRYAFNQVTRFIDPLGLEGKTPWYEDPDHWSIDVMNFIEWLLSDPPHSVPGDSTICVG